MRIPQSCETISARIGRSNQWLPPPTRWRIVSHQQPTGWTFRTEKWFQFDSMKIIIIKLQPQRARSARHFFFCLLLLRLVVVRLQQRSRQAMCNICTTPTKNGIATWACPNITTLPWSVSCATLLHFCCFSCCYCWMGRYTLYQLI